MLHEKNHTSQHSSPSKSESKILIDDTIGELDFNDISQIKRLEENSMLYFNPADESSITAAGFLHQLKFNEFEHSSMTMEGDQFRSRREQYLDHGVQEIDSSAQQEFNLQLALVKDNLAKPNNSKMDMTISKQRYCSKETVKERKFGSIKASERTSEVQDTPQIIENIKTSKKQIQMSNKTQQFLQNKKRGASLKDLLNRVDQEHTQYKEGQSNAHQQASSKIDTLKQMMSPQRGKIVDNRGTTMLNEIIGNNYQSPQKHFQKDSQNALNIKEKESGGFINQMKKMHQEKNIQLKKKQFLDTPDPQPSQQSSQSHHKNSSNQLHNSGSMSNSNEEIPINNSKPATQNFIQNKSNTPSNKLKFNFQVERAQQQHQQNTRKPVVVKPQPSTTQFPQYPGISGIATILENSPMVRGQNSSRKEHQPAIKPQSKGVYARKKLNRTGSEQNNELDTDRVNTGDNTDRSSDKNSQKVKRGTSSTSGNNRSRSKNNKGPGTYQIKTLNDFLSSSKIQKHQDQGTNLGEQRKQQA